MSDLRIKSTSSQPPKQVQPKQNTTVKYVRKESDLLSQNSSKSFDLLKPLGNKTGRIMGYFLIGLAISLTLATMAISVNFPDRDAATYILVAIPTVLGLLIGYIIS